ncbi:phage tail protein [Sulfurimonas sp.]|uniref:phage tail protein n=1 Tax=Sulfurimonas sp. TaxID=2022749 RepID=UPI0025E9BD25|nr:phage tail protein [Sulfurimonas sp.]
MIGDFKFEINDTNFEKLKKSLNIRFSAHQRLGNFDTYQKSGKHEENLEIAGTLIVKSQKQLKEFETMAKGGEPLTFVTDSSIKTILIFNVEAEQESFLKDGKFLRQSYKIVLQVVGE